jgi:small GTP-binding protein
MKLGEVVTTIPTIGFNVETVDIAGVNFTIWDVGGCDKIRPLWRHYYQNTQAVGFFVDSNDRDRIEKSVEDFDSLLSEEELRDAVFLVFANKQDLPNALQADEIMEKFGIEAKIAAGRVITVVECCAVTGEGLCEGMEWVIRALKEKSARGPSELPPPPLPHQGDDSSSSSSGSGTSREGKALTAEEAEAKRLEQMLLEWLERVDEDDDLFLQKLADATLDSWDHRTHLRIAWLLLSRHGRREGMKQIFEGIKSFIERSPRTRRGADGKGDGRGTTFHETMTYFWVHMVDYAMHATKNPTGDFRGFLLLNPQLANGGLFLVRVSKRLGQYGGVYVDGCVSHDVCSNVMYKYVLLHLRACLPVLFGSFSVYYCRYAVHFVLYGI